MMLVLDLGDPLRFHHMLRVFKPSSPMSLGTWSLTAYSLPLTLIVAIEAAQCSGLLPPGSPALERVRRSAVVIGLLPAFGSLAYKGVLFSTSSQPGWKDARWLGGFMANSALMLGCAELLAMSLLAGDARAAAALRPVAVVVLLLNIIPAALLFADLRNTLLRIYSGQQVYADPGISLRRWNAHPAHSLAGRGWCSLDPRRGVAHSGREPGCSFPFYQDPPRFAREPNGWKLCIAN